MPASSRGSVNVTTFFRGVVIKLNAKMYGMYGHFEGFPFYLGMVWVGVM